jgi:hypothetical protein
MTIGVHNQRGVHFRGVGGKDEYELAAKYRHWSRQVAIEWPFTSRVLGAKPTCAPTQVGNALR